MKTNKDIAFNNISSTTVLKIPRYKILPKNPSHGSIAYLNLCFCK